MDSQRAYARRRKPPRLVRRNRLRNVPELLRQQVLDVQGPRVIFRVTLLAALLLGLVLRLHGIHDPLLDHPSWRQGDTASIARNFALLRYNPLFPQTNYDGPPPNYVELELQIVPFLAATLYKLFGIHEIFGRLLSIAFSLGTVAVVGLFARRLFASGVAGAAAALLFAVYPGSMYYGRTFMPDTTMVFFLTAALYATWCWLEDRDGEARSLWRPALLALLAFLAKPVALLAALPIAALGIARHGWRRTLARPATWLYAAIAFIPLVAYLRFEHAIAEWHWASGITQRHVIPSLLAALHSPAAFMAKLSAFQREWGFLWDTMLGPIGSLLALAGIVLLAARALRGGTLLWSWLAAVALYGFTVVTVEPVDYYLYPVLPLAALLGGGAVGWIYARAHPVGNAERAAWLLVGAIALAGTTVINRAHIAKYFVWRVGVYEQARALDAALPKDVLIVMGHYDPAVLYYINRYGWEEDPALWTPFDQESAIRKGARYFIGVEPRRLQTNADLYHWLERYPLVTIAGVTWPVYHTDNAVALPDAERRWQEYRSRERAAGPTLPVVTPAPR
ncbi:phospholipid carrier-dependent glycosyltransferase [bacterium]|nr:MAG: phospholipid carrier-dependent glycosyltransferase [bacterium]